jgi:hypothetical protein
VIRGNNLTDRPDPADTLAPMPDAATQPEAPAGASPEQGGPASASESLAPEAIRGLSWDSPLTPEAAMEAFRTASRRGKLAGFRTLEPAPNPGGSGAVGGAGAGRTLRCVCDIFGSPYDRDLFVTLEPSAGGSVVRLDTRLRRKFPVIVVVAMVLALWPGVWLTDSLLVTYFGWYPRAGWFTPAWYIPLTLLAVPVLLKQFKSSEASAAAEAALVVRKLRRLTNAA